MKYFKVLLCEMSHNFEGYRVPDLQRYLRNHGVTITGYNKSVLKAIALAVERLQLPEDPDYLSDSFHQSIQNKLSRVGLPDCNPLTVEGYTSEFSEIPEFGLIDIFNYMIFSKADFDGRKLKGYKSYEDYRLFYDGSVESLEFNPLKDNQNCFVPKSNPLKRTRLT